MEKLQDGLLITSLQSSVREHFIQILGIWLLDKACGCGGNSTCDNDHFYNFEAIVLTLNSFIIIVTCIAL